MKNRLILSAAAVILCAAPAASQTAGQFADPPMKYRPTPLWFWNNTEVTREGVDTQLRALRDECGYGGVSILPFGARFAPEYLTDEYFGLYEYTATKAAELGMQMALYDEYGFPSGSGGAINADGVPRFARLHPDLAMKRLDKFEEDVKGGKPYRAEVRQEGELMAIVAMDTRTNKRIDLTDSVSDGIVEWDAPAGDWKVMQFVCVTDGDPNMDYLSRKAAEAYIAMTHEQYFKRMPEAFGSTITHTFFDEPTIYRAQARVWTPSFNDEFEARTGQSPALLYPALWYDIGPETGAARNLLFGVRSDLYAEAYPEAVSRWSRSHGMLATGHQDNEEVINPVGTSGDLMKCFSRQDIPGIDKIGGDRPAERFYKIVSSAAYNWDHSLVMSETYGAMGNIDWETLYGIAMDQFAKGINVLIPHAAWYDDTNVTFLPELSWRNPLYADGLYEFNTFLGRMHLMMQNEGRTVADIAVLYPIHTMQAEHRFDGPLTPYQGGVSIPYLDYVEVGEALSNSLGRDYIWLHPEVLADKCTAGRGGLKLDNEIQYNTFNTLIIPASATISVRTLEQALELFRRGGRVIFTSRLPEKAAELGKDAEIVRLTGELLPAGAESNSNNKGGQVAFVANPTPENLAAALRSDRPADISFGGRPLRYIHKSLNGRELFYLANLENEDFSGEITIRGKMNLEAWNPHTGETTPLDAKSGKQGGQKVTRAQVEIPAQSSLFIVGE